MHTTVMLCDNDINVFCILSECFQKRGAARPPGAKREAPEARKGRAGLGSLQKCRCMPLPFG